MAANIYDFTVNKITGQPVQLGEYKGKVLLVVNVASKCGLTPQYKGLENIYETYHDKGFEVLGFPANEFGKQEPGTNSEIQDFCTTNFGVKFPMFEKIVVKGEGQHPLYSFLTSAMPDAQTKPNSEFAKYGLKRDKPTDILWNFEKFLVNRKGEVIARFNPDITPDDPIITKAIEAEL